MVIFSLLQICDKTDIRPYIIIIIIIIIVVVVIIIVIVIVIVIVIIIITLFFAVDFDYSGLYLASGGSHIRLVGS